MTIAVDCTQTPRLLVDCDPTLIKIVLVNLLANAVHYGREGGRIEVRLAATRERFTVHVWNEGAGFAAADRSKLFRRFSRLNTPTEGEGPRRRGTGLGLYSAWRIIQLHDGHISATSRQGEWADFAFDIPQPLPRPEAAETEARSAG
jgi:signal transduction histidine kinase